MSSDTSKNNNTRAYLILNKMQMDFHLILYNYFSQEDLDARFFEEKIDSYFFQRAQFVKRVEKKSLSGSINIKKDQMEEVIIFLYKDLSYFINKIETDRECKDIKIRSNFNYAELKKISKKYKAIHLFKKELKNIENFIETFFIHGSFGTKDFLENWSDLDAMVVFNDDLFKFEKNLKITRDVFKKTKLYFFMIDPLSHHFTHIATSMDLKYYPQSMMPIPVYENGMHVLGKKEIEIITRDDKEEKKYNFCALCRYFKKRKDKASKNIFDLKLNLSHVLLLPSFLLEAKNIYLYKKFSFSKAREEFKEINLDIVDEASKIRREWQINGILKHYPSLLFFILPYFLNKLIIYFFVKIIQRKRPDFSEKYLRFIMSNSHKTFCNSMNILKKYEK